MINENMNTEEAEQKSGEAGFREAGGCSHECLPIPIAAGKEIADKYGYDQIIIVARRVGPDGKEHVTTYGRNKQHCAVAAKCGNFLKFKVMGWHQENVSEHNKQLNEPAEK